MYCTSYELIFTSVLRVTISRTSYKLSLSKELGVTMYCTSWDRNVNCVKFLYYTGVIRLYGLLFTKSSIPGQLFLNNVFHEWVLQL